MNIYCISLYDGVSAKTFYLTDYNNIHSLINEVLKTIFTKKYSGKSIYIHNSSEFDMIFLYSYIINFYDVKIKPIIKDGKFINLEVEYGDTTKYKVNFKDSLLLLTSSLAKLSKTFNVTYTKDMFPHNFVTKENLNYIGTVPEIKFFDNISEVEYNEYKSRFSDNNWSLKIEAIKYCELDCKALFEVIENFGFKIFKMFKINISTTPTLPSVSMKTYRTNFIPKGINIAKISGQMFDNIHKAFYGGHVDMYIPTNPIGTQVFGYDVNSLYPYVMKVNKYPYQYIGHFFGDISKMSQYFDLYLKCLGFYKVIITSPKDILNPIIPKKVDNTTVYGVGTWKGWYYSEELKNAARFGYTFDILEGYLFKAADLFSKYIETMNQMKENSVKNSPDYVIAKLLSNSLFGKFSMFRDLINYAVVEKNSVDKFISNIGFENLVNKVNIGNKCLVSYKLQFQDDLNINIAIGAAVTANARIFMTQFKNNPDYILYYSDTDSGFFNKPLPDYLVDSKRLGALKLEHVLNKFVALGPKVYGGIDLNGNEFTKTKGLKSKVSVSQLETLLQENVSLDIPQEKWFKNLVDSNIAVKDDLSYNLRANNNKRELLYKNGILVDTANKDVSD
uniref:DNA polymerase family B n=2 Tax=Hymenochaetaceae TaxID=40424 RepID=UPI00233EA68E|nr:DNA polymerase family B [Phellinus igniarius]WBU93172.1 DNA polymerase family B [Phellinus igniarius]